MDIQSIIELIIIALIIIGLAIYYVPKAIKGHWFDKIKDATKAAIAEAEKKFPGEGQGTNKKNYVLEMVKAECVNLGIPYDLIWKLISKFVDNIIDGYNTVVKK